MTNNIFGRSWEEIQDMQQKKFVRSAVPININLPQASQSDIDLLTKVGLSGLTEKGFYGVIDRLKNSGLIPDNSTDK